MLRAKRAADHWGRRPRTRVSQTGPRPFLIFLSFYRFSRAQQYSRAGKICHVLDAKNTCARVGIHSHGTRCDAS
eukprot:476825-Pyramimonas_sp.AAC.1